MSDYYHTPGGEINTGYATGQVSQSAFDPFQMVQPIVNLYEGHQNRKQAKKNLASQQKFNLQEAEKERAYNLQMWHLSNEYNSPREQMARLQAAGLNPNMAYGSGNVGGLSSGKAPGYKRADTPDFMSIPAPALSQLSTALKEYQDFRYKDAVIDQTQNKVWYQDVAKPYEEYKQFHNQVIRGQRARQEQSKTVQQRFKAKYAKQLGQYSVDAARSNVERVKESTRGMRLENEVNALLKPFGMTTKDNPWIRAILVNLQRDNPDISALDASMLIPKMAKHLSTSYKPQK